MLPDRSEAAAAITVMFFRPFRRMLARNLSTFAGTGSIARTRPLIEAVAITIAWIPMLAPMSSAAWPRRIKRGSSNLISGSKKRGPKKYRSRSYVFAVSTYTRRPRATSTVALTDVAPDRGL